MKKPIEKIIVELIQKYLNLPNDYGLDKDGNVIPCVSIRAQDIKLFNTAKMQITVSTISNEVIANRNEVLTVSTPTGNEFIEKVYTNEKRIMQIDVYSKNNEARDRFIEVQASLTSIIAEELQDLYQFKIGELSTSNNLSGLDGGSNVNRYTIRFNCLVWNELTRNINYYDKFRAKAQVDNDIVYEFDMTKG